MSETEVLRVGVAGLGWAANEILVALNDAAEARLVAAADPRENARNTFCAQYGGRGYGDIAELVTDPEVDAVWIATPTHLHCEHAVMAAESHKHVVVEKPFAVSLAECQQMIEAAANKYVVLISGGVRRFDPAIVEMRRVIESGRLGRLGALTSWSYTPWMVLPRERHEVDTRVGGGLIYNQGPHVIDALRMLGGGLVKSVRGITGQWMPERPCPGYFSAMLEFADGTPATLAYDGHGYVLGWEFVPWGETKSRMGAAEAIRAFRRQLRIATADERQAREHLRFGGGDQSTLVAAGDGGWIPGDAGLIVAACEKGDVRQSRSGLFVYDDFGRHEEPLAGPGSSRQNELKELCHSVRGAERPLHDGAWGMATTEVLLAIMESAESHTDVALRHQVSVDRK